MGTSAEVPQKNKNSKHKTLSLISSLAKKKPLKIWYDPVIPHLGDLQRNVNQDTIETPAHPCL
jgi:hypothetical protein